MNPGKYTYDVLLEAQPDGTHQASVLGWADCRAIAATAEEAVAILQQVLSDRIVNAQIVQLEIPRPESQLVPNPENPWLKFSGVFKDDPMFDEVLNDIEQYRQELDVIAAQEEDLDSAA